jgi:uncharacterized surface protein with fasciclin (FAS1) repeats
MEWAEVSWHVQETQSLRAQTLQHRFIAITPPQKHMATWRWLFPAAGLVDTRNVPGPFTVFAPTDEAFATLSSGTLEMLLKPENNKQLVEILSYHVVPGVAAYSDAVIKMREVPTLLGTPIVVKFVNGKGR